MLRIVLTLLGLLIIGRFGFTGAVLGPEWLPGADLITPTLDSEYRFLAVCAAGLGVLLLWLSRAPLQHPALLHNMATTFAGGLARMTAASVMEWPARPALVAMVIELAVPLLAWALWFREKSR